jgi:hypothetical protein
LQDTFIIVASYVTYSICVFLLFLSLTPEHNMEQNSNISGIGKNIIAYLLALRGFVDSVLWFGLHDFGGSISTSNNNNNNSNKLKTKTYTSMIFSKLFSAPLLEANDRESALSSTCEDVEIPKDSEGEEEGEGEGGGEGDFGIDLDLSPQLNMALRLEVVHFTTMGIIRSVDFNTTASSSSSSSTDGDGDGGVPPLAASSRKSSRSHSVSEEEEVRVFPLDEAGHHIFSDYAPETFRRLRVLNGVEEAWYQHQVSQPTKERIAEGGSGAFMFFCGSGEFMVRVFFYIY